MSDSTYQTNTNLPQINLSFTYRANRQGQMCTGAFSKGNFIIEVNITREEEERG